jgi:hypothetical protein
MAALRSGPALLLFAGLPGLLGCTDVRPARMVAVTAEPARATPLAGTIGLGRVSMPGGIFVGMSPWPISEQNLREAVRLSLARVGYLAPGDSPPRFALDVAVVWLEPPSGGQDAPATAWMIIRYRLARQEDGQVLLDDLRITSCKTSAPAYDPVTLECAVQRNLGALLNALGDLAPSVPLP